MLEQPRGRPAVVFGGAHQLQGFHAVFPMPDLAQPRGGAMAGYVAVGMVIGLALEAWAFSADLVDGALPATQGWVALIAAHVFVLFFALSWGVVVWVMLGEMFPNRIRAAALGVAAAAQWVANWAITASFPSLADWNLSVTYVIYAVFAALSIPFVLKFVKETKGKALEEMG